MIFKVQVNAFNVSVRQVTLISLLCSILYILNCLNNGDKSSYYSGYDFFEHKYELMLKKKSSVLARSKLYNWDIVVRSNLWNNIYRTLNISLDYFWLNTALNALMRPSVVLDNCIFLDVRLSYLWTTKLWRKTFIILEKCPMYDTIYYTCYTI